MVCVDVRLKPSLGLQVLFGRLLSASIVHQHKVRPWYVFSCQCYRPWLIIAYILGPCEFKLHEEYIKVAFEKQGTAREREQYELKLLDYLRYLIADLDRKSRRAQERLSAKPVIAPISENMLNPILRDELEEKSVACELEAGRLLDELEALTRVPEHLEGQGVVVRPNLIQGVWDLDRQIDHVYDDYKRIQHQLNPHKAQQQEKEMHVCDVCGSMLVVNDDQKRLETHYEGRQHTGYLAIRTHLAKLSVSERHPLFNQCSLFLTFSPCFLSL